MEGLRKRLVDRKKLEKRRARFCADPPTKRARENECDMDDLALQVEQARRFVNEVVNLSDEEMRKIESDIDTFGLTEAVRQCELFIRDLEKTE